MRARMLRRWLACMLGVVGLCAMLPFIWHPMALAAASDAPQSIVSDGAAFGLSAAERAQTGMSKTYSQKYYGYVFPLGRDAADDFSVVVGADAVIAYVPAASARKAGFTASDVERNTFQGMIESLDDGLSNGGAKIAELGLPWVFTSEPSYTRGPFHYEFGVEIEDGYYYTVCTYDAPKGVSADEQRALDKTAGRFEVSGHLLPADQVAVEQRGSWLDELGEFLSPEELDYRPLWVSLKTAGVAMIFIFIFGMLAARRAMHVKSRWKGLFDSIFTIPMVLPPTVCGFILLVVFGQSTAFGRWLIDHGVQLVFSWPAAVLAATVVGFPLMYRTVLGAFEALDTNMLDAARTLGWSEGRIFRKLMLPLAWPSIAAGLVLAFARAMGEFGATLFVAGNYAGVTQTMPIAIYFAWMGGNTAVAVFWVVVVIVISFIIILIINLYSAHAQRFRKAGGRASRRGGEVIEAGEVSFAIDGQVAAELGFGRGNAASGQSVPVGQREP